MTHFHEIIPDDETLREESEGYPFKLTELWQQSALASDPSEVSNMFSVQPDLTQTNTKILSQPWRPELPDGSLFTLPKDFNLSLATFGVWPPSNVSSSSAGSSDNVALSDVEDDDPWLRLRPAEASLRPRFNTWDSFLVPTTASPTNPYLSEAGPQVLDAAIEEHLDDKAGIVVRSDVFCTCLLHLALGRSSVLFVYDRTDHIFKPVRERMRISGCTADMVDNIIRSFANCGSNVKRLQRFADDVYAVSSSADPSMIALAQCATDVVEAIQKCLAINPQTIRSVLYLRSLIWAPALIVEIFAELVEKSNASHGCEILSRLFDVVQRLQHRSGWLRPLLVESLGRVCRPWLEFIEHWIGLHKRTGGMGFDKVTTGGFFVLAEEVTGIDESGKPTIETIYSFDKSHVPSFLAAESAESIFETGKSLRFLEAFHPNHPLARPDTVHNPQLEWKFSWQDLYDLQEKAKGYEQRLRSAIKKYTKGEHQLSLENAKQYDVETMDPFETFGRSKEEINNMLGFSLDTMNQSPPPIEAVDGNNVLSSMVLASSHLDATASEHNGLTTFAPPLSITPMMSFSHLFTTQSRLVNKACLRMFFKEHSIRTHLTLLRRFQLFGDGVFSSKLAHALFDDELDTTQRQLGKARTGGTMGLRLGSRDSWPPASSELRLALMDVLSESIFPSNTKHGIHRAGKEGELPGGLSFAVREMSAEELEKCMDPDGIDALEFLKLHYKPPSPLEAIITETSLYRYDKIFRLLLRILRMLFVVNMLFRDSMTRSRSWKGIDPVTRKFCVEAHHFVSALGGYMVESGIGTTWARFEHKLLELEQWIEKDEDDSEYKKLEGEGLEKLRAYHESILDRIMFATLSRKRQAPVMKIVNEIFEAILKFAKTVRGCVARGAMNADEREEVVVLYTSFKRRVSIFISVCRGLSEKRGYGDGRKDLEGRRAVDSLFGTGYKEEANMLQMLLLKMEMTGYYSDTKSG